VTFEQYSEVRGIIKHSLDLDLAAPTCDAVWLWNCTVVNRGIGCLVRVSMGGDV